MCNFPTARTMNLNAPSTAEMEHILKAKYGSLMNDFDFKQENGQRKLTHIPMAGPEGYLHSPPEEGSEVFIGRLPRDLYEDELLDPFLKMGNIFEIRLMMNFSGVTRGFAFVNYYRVSSARKAIQYLNNLEIRPGHRIGVLLSKNNRHLQVGPVLDMHPQYPLVENEILYLLREETSGIEKIILVQIAGPKGLAYKKIILRYRTHRDAALARRILIPKKDYLFGRMATVDWAGPELISALGGQC